ncbi:MAG: hypothetical protein PW790_06780 [Parvibaculaceae bacterium]|nr:hypothetical protein [Parvibaculaceae bacterium]
MEVTVHVQAILRLYLTGTERDAPATRDTGKLPQVRPERIGKLWPGIRRKIENADSGLQGRRSRQLLTDSFSPDDEHGLSFTCPQTREDLAHVLHLLLKGHTGYGGRAILNGSNLVSLFRANMKLKSGDPLTNYVRFADNRKIRAHIAESGPEPKETSTPKLAAEPSGKIPGIASAMRNIRLDAANTRLANEQETYHVIWEKAHSRHEQLLVMRQALEQYPEARDLAHAITAHIADKSVASLLLQPRHPAAAPSTPISDVDELEKLTKTIKSDSDALAAWVDCHLTVAAKERRSPSSEPVETGGLYQSEKIVDDFFARQENRQAFVPGSPPEYGSAMIRRLRSFTRFFTQIFHRGASHADKLQADKLQNKIRSITANLRSEEALNPHMKMDQPGDMEIGNYLATLKVREAIDQHYPVRRVFFVFRAHNKIHKRLMAAMAPLILEKPEPAIMPNRRPS